MKSYIFPIPVDARCELLPDSFGSQPAIVGTPDSHPSNGAPCQSFDVPASVPNRNGASLTISKKGYASYVMHGILDVTTPTGFTCDVFQLQKAGGVRPFRLDGHFCRYADDGTEMLINESTGFRLFSRFVNGEMAQADAFCQSCVDNKINMVRVAVMQDTSLYLSDPSLRYRIHPDDHSDFYHFLDEFVGSYLAGWGLYPDLICCTQTQTLMKDPARQVAHVHNVFDVMTHHFGFVSKVNEHGIYDNSVDDVVLNLRKQPDADFLLSTGSQASGVEDALEPLGDLCEMHLNDLNEWWRKGHNAWEMSGRYNRGGYVSETTRTDKESALYRFTDDAKTQIAMTLSALIHTPEGKNADPFDFSLAHLDAHNAGVFDGGVNFRRGQYGRKECGNLRCYSMTVPGVGVYAWDVHY